MGENYCTNALVNSIADFFRQILTSLFATCHVNLHFIAETDTQTGERRESRRGRRANNVGSKERKEKEIHGNRITAYKINKIQCTSNELCDKYEVIWHRRNAMREFTNEVLK